MKKKRNTNYYKRSDYQRKKRIRVAKHHTTRYGNSALSGQKLLSTRRIANRRRREIPEQTPLIAQGFTNNRGKAKTNRLTRIWRNAMHRRCFPKRSRLTINQRKAKLERLQEQRREKQRLASSLRHKELLRKKRIAARRPKHYTYADCLRDEVPVPTKRNGTTLYQTLVVGGMTAIMVTVSGVGADGVSFIVRDHWLYPMVFSISFLTRIYITVPLNRILESRLIGNRLQGAARTIVSTVLGTVLSSPVTCAIVTLLFADENGLKGYMGAYLASLSTTAPLSVLVSLFVVCPLAKLVFNNRIKPAGGLRILGTIIEHTGSITRIFGF